jgi:hypothetical protein
MKKKAVILITCFAFLVNFPQLAYCKKAIRLSDAQLDNISAAGFDINIDAIYAFRAAVINQSNIGSIVSLNSDAKLSINASNQALVSNNYGQTITNQKNLSAIVAKVGNITDAVIQNINALFVKNEPAAATEAVQREAAQTEALQTAELQTAAVQTEAPVETPAATQAVESLATPVSVEVSAPAADAVATDASTLTNQINIAAVVALEGSVDKADIDNLNSANLSNAVAIPIQTNIAIVIAKADIENIIENVKINNVNITSVDNNIGNAISAGQVFTLSHNEISGEISINHSAVSDATQAIQRNITFIKSLTGNIKNQLIKDLNFKKVHDFH